MVKNKLVHLENEWTKLHQLFSVIEQEQLFIKCYLIHPTEDLQSRRFDR